MSVGESYSINLDTDLFPDEITYIIDGTLDCLSINPDTGVITCVQGGGDIFLAVRSYDYPELPPLIFVITTLDN